MALKTMSIDKLRDMKSKIEAAISVQVSERRRELETELSKLARFGGGGKAIKFGRGGPKGPVAPKYRNSENPTETWAGRGLKPRWLAAAIKGGKKPTEMQAALLLNDESAVPNKQVEEILAGKGILPLAIP